MKRVVMSKCATVRLRDLTWTIASLEGDQCFLTSLPTGAVHGSKAHIAVNGYSVYYASTGIANLTFTNARGGGTSFWIRNDAYSTVEAFVQAEGDKTIIYETTTPRRCLPVTYKAQQLIKNGDFSDGLSNWSQHSTSIVGQISSEGLTVDNLSNANYYLQSFRLKTTHKYCALAMLKTESAFNVSIRVSNSTDTGIVRIGANTWALAGSIARDLTRENVSFSVRNSSSTETKVTIRWCSLVDLTALYGEGSEPTSVETFLSQHPEYNSYVPFYDGKITQRRIIETKAKSVDIGLLNALRAGGTPYYYFLIKIADGVFKNGQDLNINGYSNAGYASVTSSLTNMSYTCREDGSIYFRNDGCADATAFKQSMQGKILTYQTTT